MREEITKLLLDVGKHYRNKGLVEGEIKRGHDIHAFYRLTKNPSQVIHVQAYPGLSNENEARVWARMMNYDEMMEIRNSGRVSPGNEHEATVRFFPNFDNGIMIPYDPEALKEKLEEIVWDLR